MLRDLAQYLMEEKITIPCDTRRKTKHMFFAQSLIFSDICNASRSKNKTKNVSPLKLLLEAT